MNNNEYSIDNGASWHVATPGQVINVGEGQAIITRQRQDAAQISEMHPVIDLLLTVTRCAFDAMDGTEQDDTGQHWDKADFDALSAAMDALEALPDDQPGFVMGPAAKAAWALRNASQLADSTASGAGKFDTSTTIMLDVCELDYSGEAESTDTMRVDAADLRLILDRHLAAPTAQQSLTAVLYGHMFWDPLHPDGEASAFMVQGSEDPATGKPDWQGHVWKSLPLYLAPLMPQVQASEAARDVLAERRRQIDVEGYHEAHDDDHDEDGDLARAAICYIRGHRLFGNVDKPHDMWPWAIEWWKPTTPRRNLVKAGALILAEIERLDRAADQQPVTPSGTLGMADNAGERPLKGCAAGRDGDCIFSQCPQLRDNEPRASGRHCPLDKQPEKD